MTPPGPPPGPPGASYPPYTTSSSIPAQLLSLLMQAQPLQQQQAQDQQAQQQERERERQADRRLGQLEAIAAFQALLAAQRQQTAAAPNARAALQELTRMVTASCSTSGGQDVLSSFPERRQLRFPPANNINNAMTGGGLSSSSATTGTLLEQLLLRELQQQQRQASASSQQTIPPAAAIRSMTENSMDNTSSAAWATNSNNQNSNLRHTGELKETTATTTTTTTTTTATLASKAKITKTTTSPQKERHENFPEKLYRMLTELEAKGQDDVISFSAKGDTFEIHQPEVFEDEASSSQYDYCTFAISA
jgi:hypothetical protein